MCFKGVLCTLSDQLSDQISLSSFRQNGRSSCNKRRSTPKVMTALSLAAKGMSQSDAAAEINMTPEGFR